jgi:hypothetical protein
LRQLESSSDISENPMNSAVFRHSGRPGPYAILGREEAI